MDASRREASKQALVERLKHKEDRHNTMLRVVKRGCAVAVVTLLTVFGADVALKRQWLVGKPSPDDQQYVIEGREIDPELIDGSRADGGFQPRALTTTSLDELIAFLGYTPATPAWIPDGWIVESYYARKANTIQFDVMYQDLNNDFLLRFGIETYPDIETATQVFEQEHEGGMEVCNGWAVYFTQNVERCVAVWRDGTICYSLSGPIPLDEARKMINSIARSE